MDLRSSNLGAQGSTVLDLWWQIRNQRQAPQGAFSNETGTNFFVNQSWGVSLGGVTLDYSKGKRDGEDRNSTSFVFSRIAECSFKKH